MCKTRGLWRTMVVLAVAALLGVAWAGEAPKEPEKPDKPKNEPPKIKAGPKVVEGTTSDVVAKVNDKIITRRDLEQLRRRLAATARPGTRLPNNEGLLERLINNALFRAHFEEKKLLPPPAEVQARIRAMDADLRRQRSSYQRWLAAQGFSAEEHASVISQTLARQRLVDGIQKEIPEEKVRAEFDAHPGFYDGSRIRIGEIFIDTAGLGNDAEKLKDAKDRIDKLHAELVAGKEFERLARDYSEGKTSDKGGELGWAYRKSPDEYEPLIAAAWALKAGEFTKPFKSTKGWYILKVTEREPAHYTYFGCKRAILGELVRQRLEAVLKGLKAKAKIEKLLEL